VPDSPFARGARLFDAGAFFDAHEAWEERWLVETNETQRRLLQGLIQIAAAFHKLVVMGAADSASRLFARGLAKLDASAAKIAGMSVSAFRDAVRGFARDLAAGRFDRSAVPKIDLDRDREHDRDPSRS
jgi:predicted metal-dependent hydrolase